jgi:hypothetical protein
MGDITLARQKKKLKNGLKLSLVKNDFRAELLQKGALTIDWGREFYTFGEAGWMAHASEPSDLISITCSRPLLE